jgi:hypothetical protein
LAWT